MTKNSDGTGPLSRGAGGAAAAAAAATCAKTTTRATSGIEGTMLDRRVSEKAPLYLMALALPLPAAAAAAAGRCNALHERIASCVAHAAKMNRFEPK